MQASGDLAQNLHYLSGHYRSVAEVCRRIGINRQQFNKYLSGVTMPSMHNFKRIADFFGVEEGELLLPHAEFIGIVMRRPVGMDVPQGLRTFLHDSRQKFAQSKIAMARYCGLYHAIFQSPAWPNGILRTLYAISSDETLTYAKSIERLAWAHKRDSEPFVHKYQGLALLDNNRLYLFECQPQLTSIYSTTILYPSNRSRVTSLNGLLTSVTGGVSRNPFASRVVFERIADQDDFRGALARCGVFRFDSDEIDADIKDRIDNSVSGPAGVLTATEY
jgi:transcriptional regulator with XRE-family HTH domain